MHTRTFELWGFGIGLLVAVASCSSSSGSPVIVGAPPVTSVVNTNSMPSVPFTPVTGAPAVPAMTDEQAPPPVMLPPKKCTLTCAELNWSCGYLTNECGDVIDCAKEGLDCKSGEVCSGGVDAPTKCVASGGGSCELCSFLPNCDDKPQATRLTGRVITPGRTDADAGNQVGVPNALVYILQNNVDTLPEIPVGIPNGGTACDRCEDQESQLGDVLFGAITDATGAFTIEKYVPVGHEFTIVVKAGKFRRAVRYTVPEASACQTVNLPVALPENPTRLPRNKTDGQFVHIPKIAVSTGQIDAMECVLEKLGLAHEEFSNPGADAMAAARIHLYRGGSATKPAGASIDTATPHDKELYGTLARLQSYDLVVADCEGQSYDKSLTERDASGANVREYVNRGGRMFASHLSFTWLAENGTKAYDAAAPIETGLGPAATWDLNANSNPNTGNGIVSTDSPNASPRLENFTAWLQNEKVIKAPENNFTIVQPRSQVTGLGAASEEFIHCDDSDGTGDCKGSAERIQQFSFNTPYSAPEKDSCGRVAYSGFHVAATADSSSVNGAFENAVFPAHCKGNLTDQEKVLLYMLFDLGACVGDPPPPPVCTPKTCEELKAKCGHAPNGCGGVLDCGPCQLPTLG